ncbi:1182_t:CDS:2 [Scutellospora calospora]|uniref:1182_t:CDS:1 n=1 Tax=Scutellospora calospora TaxID=85575 RepID=A0ACA9KZZ3_9GLOM|nr:1182_t:CDS:2 [Scutellospora calospora]
MSSQDDENTYSDKVNYLVIEDGQSGIIILILSCIEISGVITSFLEI